MWCVARVTCLVYLIPLVPIALLVSISVSVSVNSGLFVWVSQSLYNVPCHHRRT